MFASLSIWALNHVPTVRPGDDLCDLTLSALERCGVGLLDGDIIVLAQKIVSKSEGRTVLLGDIRPSARAAELAAIAQKDPRVVELILSESVEVVRCRPGVIIVRDKRGFVIANAGIDASNVEAPDGEEAVILLPEDPDGSAERLRAAVALRSGRRVGVVINDSFGRAWRLGTIGTALGAAGIPALVDLRGRPDRNGRPLQSSELAIADEIAAAASLTMGQADEGRPLVLMRGVPYGEAKGSARHLVRPKAQDLFP